MKGHIQVNKNKKCQTFAGTFGRTCCVQRTTTPKDTWQVRQGWCTQVYTSFWRHVNHTVL